MTMPALGESVTEGTVTRWLKAVGDEVTADEPLLEVSTDKVDTEIPSPVSGTLLSITVNEDETVDVGARAGRHRRRPVARRPPRRPRQPPQQEAPKPEAPAAAPSPQEAAADARRRPRTDTGTARRRLRRQRRQPASAHRQPAPAPQVAPQAAGRRQPSAGDGARRVRHAAGPPAGRRPRRRPEHASPAPASAGGSASRTCSPRPRRPRRRRRPPPHRPRRPRRRTPSPAAMPDTSVRGRTEKLSRLRAVIARRMVESLQVSAQLTTVVEADVTRIARLRAAGEERLRGPRGRQALVPAVLREGGHRGAQGAPVGELLDRPGSRHGHLPRHREPRHRGGHRARPARAGHPRGR